MLLSGVPNILSALRPLHSSMICCWLVFIHFCMFPRQRTHLPSAVSLQQRWHIRHERVSACGVDQQWLVYITYSHVLTNPNFLNYGGNGLHNLLWLYWFTTVFPQQPRITRLLKKPCILSHTVPFWALKCWVLSMCLRDLSVFVCSLTFDHHHVHVYGANGRLRQTLPFLQYVWDLSGGDAIVRLASECHQLPDGHSWGTGSDGKARQRAREADKQKDKGGENTDTGNRTSGLLFLSTPQCHPP